MQRNWGWIHRLCSPTKNGLTTAEAVIKKELSEPTLYWDWDLSKFATHMEAGTNELIQSFLRMYNESHVVLTLELKQKTIAFYQNRDIAMKSLIVLYQTSPTVVETFLLMQNYIHSQREMRTFPWKLEKLMRANYRLIRWVNPCRHDFIHFGI